MASDTFRAFHYSDIWADPGRQEKPAAWADLSFEELQKAVADHTTDVLSAIKARGIDVPHILKYAAVL